MKNNQAINSKQITARRNDHYQNSTQLTTQFKHGKILPPIKSKGQIVPQQFLIQGKKLEKSKEKTKFETIQSNVVSKKQRKFQPDQYDEKAIVLCQFCGGQSCPQQDYLTNKIQPNAIQGLHSNWITQNILAMQRPSNQLIEKFHLMQQFKKYNINTILNLQEPGEHPYCGPGIDPMVGFSYDPQLFFNNGIRFQNQYWEDMTSTTFQQMMKIMNIFHRSIVQKRGKMSVHCHAGRGRTLMAICAWLIYHDRMTAQQTITLAVQKRQGVLTRTSQRDFLRDFQKQLQKRWRSYSHQITNQHLKTFTEFISWQNVSFLKSQKQKFNQTSFAHGTLFQILRNRMKQQHKQIIYSFIDLNSQIFSKKWDKEHQHRATFLKTYIDKKKINKIQQNQDIRVLAVLLEDFYDQLPFTPISLHAIDILRKQVQIQEQNYKMKGTKRQVTKIQNMESKILKRWEDIISQRPQNTIMRDQPNSPPKFREQQNQQRQDREYDPQSNNTNNTNFLKLQSNPKYPKNMKTQTQGAFQKSFSDIELNSFYLNIISEPSILHQVGLHSLTTLIDIVKFVKDLLQIYKQSNPSQKQQHYQTLQTCILTKFSLILQSKKQYFPVLFRGPHFRQSKLLQKITKIQKYTNHNIVYLANFMKNLMKQIPDDQNQYKKLVFKLYKVETNINFFSKSYSKSNNGKFFSIKDVQKVYQESRIM